jgi:hypothetical protein
MKDETARHAIALRRLEQLAVRQVRAGGGAEHEKSVHEPFVVSDGKRLGNHH